MSAIRDFAVTEQTTATTSVTPDMPTHASGDLLIVFFNKDTNSAATETLNLGIVAG